MADDEEAAIDARKKSHDAIDDAIRQHLSDLDIPGICTGWVVVTSISAMEEEDEFDMMYSTQSDGLTKWAQVGLLTMSLDGAKRDGYMVD